MTKHTDKAGDGKITQHKQTIGEGMASDKSLSEVGEGSMTETAPAVKGKLAETEASSRVVQQGDEVVLHTRNASLNGRDDNHGLVLKVNQDKTIAVRVQRADGNGTHDFSPVYDGPRNGEDWWSWPAENELDDARKAE